MSKAAKWKGFGLVRDKNGKPKIDNPETLPEETRSLLTDDEYFSIYKTKRI
jgi:hypothetical protein